MKVILEGEDFQILDVSRQCNSQDAVLDSCIRSCGEFACFTMHVPKVCGGVVVGLKSSQTEVAEVGGGGDSRLR